MEETTLKYRRQDTEGGYLFDKSDIEYYKATQRNDVIDNLLLGDFNMVGAYVVNNAIVEELLKLRKIYTDSYSKSIFCESIKKFNGESIKFKLNILPNTPSYGKITASLELLEEISRTNGYYKNINTVLLDSKIFNNDKNVNQNILQTFNIVDKKDDKGTAKIENDYECQNIIKRRTSLLELGKRGISVNAKLEKELFDKRITLFKANNKCAVILEEFNRQVFHIQNKFLDTHNPKYYRHLNQILDGIYDMYGYLIANDNKLMSGYRKLNSMYAERHNKADMVLTSEQIRIQIANDKKEYQKFIEKSKEEVGQEIQSKKNKVEIKAPEITDLNRVDSKVKELQQTEIKSNNKSSNLSVSNMEKENEQQTNLNLNNINKEEIEVLIETN